MKFKFKAVIYKIGINPVVDVPGRITSKMKVTRGYIPVKGEIHGFAFHQTLCPVKNAPYLLYINGPMIRGAKVSVGEEVLITLTYDDRPPKDEIDMPAYLEKRLKEEKMLHLFSTWAPSRKKEIYRYLNRLKSEEARSRNISKVILLLKKIQRP